MDIVFELIVVRFKCLIILMIEYLWKNCVLIRSYGVMVFGVNIDFFRIIYRFEIINILVYDISK